MLFSNIKVVGPDMQCSNDMYVGVRGNTIAYVDKVAPTEDFGEVYEGAGKVLMPGLVNAHTHSPMSLLRGYAEDLPLSQWLQEKVWPFEAKIDDDAALWATRLSIAEMLRFGTVSFTDMYLFDSSRVQAVAESGIKANLSHGVLAFDPTLEYQDMPDYQAIENMISEHNGSCEGRLKVEIGPHAEYDVSEKAMRGMAEQAAEHGVGLHIHISETRSEHMECMQRHNGMTPVAYLETLGIFDSPTTAAHCVWATDDDLQILAAHNATVATCPASNLKLGSGVPSTLRFLESGVNIGIGTDGVSSNNALNMFRDMYLAAIAHRGASEQALGVTAADVLKAATVGGMRAQRRDDSGSIEVGKKADLVVVDLDLVWMTPATDVISTLVYSAQGTEVVLTMVDGKVLYRDGQWPTIDVERAMSETAAARDRITEEIKQL